MRAASARNDADRATLLVVTGGVMLAVLAAVATETGGKDAPQPHVVALIMTTLMLAWSFSTVVYVLHHARLCYLPDGRGGGRGGLDVPNVAGPDYWDMPYFSATLGMTFQTSDVAITSRAVRRVATGHALIAFVYDIGVLALTINVPGAGNTASNIDRRAPRGIRTTWLS